MLAGAPKPFVVLLRRGVFVLSTSMSLLPMSRRRNVTIARRLNKPYFVFRPKQVLRRIAVELQRRQDGPDVQLTELPWGLPLEYHREEQIGLCIARRGVFDMTVSETLFRLADPGETALDVGANVGHMTSLLVARVGSRGRVLAFEPHPGIRAALQANADRWRQHRVAQVEVRGEALSHRAGEATLFLEPGFAWNRGSASLREDAPVGSTGLVVAAARLDDILEDDVSVGVMKLDVEGHEAAVLEGAGDILSEHRIRDIVFEDFGMPPTPLSERLQGLGYTVFSLDHTLLGPVLRPPWVKAGRDSGDDPSYLATSDPQRARLRLEPHGWMALGSPRLLRR